MINKLKKIIGILLFAAFIIPANANAQSLSSRDTANVHFLNARKFYIYKVEKGETLFGISQKFAIPQEEILEFNHDISKNGLKAKMKLWIPAYSWLKKDSIEKIVLKEVIPAKYTYKIAIITALNIPKQYTENDSSASYINEPLSDELKTNLEFIEGIAYAADVLKSEGIKFHFYYIDSESDSSKVLLKLRKSENPDMIITNESNSVLKGISAYSLVKNVSLIPCALNSSEIIKDNSKGLSLLPSSGKQCEMMGKFSREYFKNAYLITLKTSNQKENDRSEFFKNGWLSVKESFPRRIDCTKGNVAGIADSLSKGKNNLIFIPSSNEDFVSTILNSLKLKIPDYEFTVIGLPTWQYFETIDQKTIEDCNVFVFNSGFIDFKNNEVFKFRKFFREKYYSEPSESAYQGYDALWVAGKLFLKYGNKIAIDENQKVIEGIYSLYSFDRISGGTGFENRNIHVFQPGKDLSNDLTKNNILK